MHLISDKTICLAIMVKDEERRIRRCFDTVKDQIDYWVVCDTGSTDGTLKVARSFANEVPGEVHQVEWQNFGHNRTKLLELARGKADYILTLDADEGLVGHIDKSRLTKPAYFVQYAGDLDYWVPYLVDGNREWRYSGVTHEFLEGLESWEWEKLPGARILDWSDGGNRKGKFERDVELLRQALQEDPTDKRSMFYLANSFRDLRKWKEAEVWYLERIKAGGWREEVTCSFEELGRCYEMMKRPEQAIDTWIAGYEWDPSRAECLYNAVRLLRERGRNRVAWQLCKAANAIPYPKDDLLFVKRRVYELLIPYEVSLLAYYGNDEVDVWPLYHRLLESGQFDTAHLLHNYSFYVKKSHQRAHVSPEIAIFKA